MALDFLSISDLKVFISVLMSINEDVQVSFDFLFWFDRPVNRSLRFSNLCSMFLEKASKVLNIFDVVWTRVSKIRIKSLVVGVQYVDLILDCTRNLISHMYW